jgi:hypothetical protein
MRVPEEKQQHNRAPSVLHDTSKVSPVPCSSLTYRWMYESMDGLEIDNTDTCIDGHMLIFYSQMFHWPATRLTQPHPEIQSRWTLLSEMHYDTTMQYNEVICIRSIICVVICTSTHSLIHSLTHSLIHSLTHSFIHSFNHSLTHSLTHSFIHSPFGLGERLYTGCTCLHRFETNSPVSPLHTFSSETHDERCWDDNTTQHNTYRCIADTRRRAADLYSPIKGCGAQK